MSIIEQKILTLYVVAMEDQDSNNKVIKMIEDEKFVQIVAQTIAGFSGVENLTFNVSRTVSKRFHIGSKITAYIELEDEE